MLFSRMDKKSVRDNFTLQAGILASAGIITRIIGLLYRSPLQRVIGNLGLGYYSSAYNFYTIILLISSYSIPAAISKVIAQKLALKEYRNVDRLLRCAFAYVCAVGGAASLFLFFAAGWFVSPEAVPVLRMFAPTIFIYGILGVLRGFFQAQKTMVPTSVSQIIEQIANAAVSIGGAFLLIRILAGDPMGQSEKEILVSKGIHGAMGSALGTGAGVLTALIFMSMIYARHRKSFREAVENDRSEQVDSYGQIMKMIFLVVTPFILNTAICNFSGNVNNIVYTKLYPIIRNLDTIDTYSAWSLFSGQAQTISNIPIAFATAMATAMIPTVAQLIAAKNQETAKERIALAVKTTMVISIPCAVGLFVLAAPITCLLFWGNTSAEEWMAAKLLMALSLSVVFYAYSTLNSQILQGLGRVNAPIVNAAVSLLVQTAVAVGLLFFTQLDLYSIALASAVYAGLLCCLNHLSVRRAIGYRQEVMNTFVRPFAAAAVMGVFCKVLYQALLFWTKSPRISVIPAVLLGAVVYFAVLILFRGITKEELRSFPKGNLLVKLAVKCRLMK